MATESIFFKFCTYVDENIFPFENKGEVIAFIVDQTFINDFCKEYHTSEKELLSDASLRRYSVSRNAFLTKGMIALQVFAATKRANSDGITERNYRDRLDELLFHDIGELQRWMTDYQDAMWKTFYDWCESNDFRVSRRCKPGYGTGRYVQYPLQEALRVFTTEALLNFARAFVENHLSPEDDLSFNTFWEIVPWRSLSRYIDSNNASRIYYNPSFTEDAKQQIYNYFLRWDGEYRIRNGSEAKKRVTSSGNLVYLSKDYDALEIRDVNGKLLSSFALTSLRYQTVVNTKNHIPVRRKGVFLFKWDDLYQIWQECHYLEEGESGIALVFPDETNWSYAFRLCPVLVTCPKLKVYKLSPDNTPHFLITEKKTCYLEGGLKVGRDTYLVGAAPFLVREQSERVRIDKDLIESTEARINLVGLGIGEHVINVPGRKPIRFELVAPHGHSPRWDIKFQKWDIGAKKPKWGMAQIEEGVSGMDLSPICQTKYTAGEDKPATRAWAETFLSGSFHHPYSALRTLNNIRDYGEL